MVNKENKRKWWHLKMPLLFEWGKLRAKNKLLATTILTLFALAYLFWSVKQVQLRQQYEIVLQNKYQRAFYDLLTHSEKVEALLSKSLVAQDPKVDARLFLELWQEAMEAKASLGQLPLADIDISRTVKYMTQVGDFAYSLAKKIGEGKTRTEEEWQTLQKLYQQATDLNSALHEVEREISTGQVALSEMVFRQKNYFQKQAKLANENFLAIEKHMRNFPTLIYDGPFSDHLERREWKGLPEKEVTSEEAQKNALAFIEKRSGVDYKAQVVAVQDKSNVSMYRIEITAQPLQTNLKITTGVSKRGGKVIWFTAQRPIGPVALSLKQAQEKAQSFLNNRGFTEIIPTYHEQVNGLAVFNFAARQGNVVLYPDLMKVAIALDNGEVVGFDASSYYDSHVVRNLPAPLLTPEDARKRLSPKLEQVSGGRLALIPLEVDQEKLTYEFEGTLNGDTYLIYINALTGEEEEVLRLMQNAEGIHAL